MQQFQIIVNDGCKNDVLTLVSSTFVAQFYYYINEDTDIAGFPTALTGTSPLQKIYVAEWSNSVVGCPVDFEL